VHLVESLPRPRHAPRVSTGFDFFFFTPSPDETNFLGCAPPTRPVRSVSVRTVRDCYSVTGRQLMDARLSPIDSKQSFLLLPSSRSSHLPTAPVPAAQP
jgi:hypothetical protein